MQNPRYTGYAFFGRWTKTEVLLDPDDPSAGHTTRFRRASPDHVVRSRMQAHHPIVTVQQFTQVQLLRHTKTLAGRSKTERSGHPTRHAYLFQGLIRCRTCNRKMQSSTTGPHHYYRCVPRDSFTQVTHPHSISVREDKVQRAVTTWLEELNITAAANTVGCDDLATAAINRDDDNLAKSYHDLQLVVVYDHRTSTLTMSLQPQEAADPPHNRIQLWTPRPRRQAASPHPATRCYIEPR
ncbi:zinc ribbon domain-containing protein [Amycolatopsis sp. NPDC051373]|uniref:zinc ribbon domain-containing protein n=1 Tax=Amycolatopsis sp. NPDC051373 TaxID=3155801 RepID=UPI00344C96D5